MASIIKRYGNGKLEFHGMTVKENDKLKVKAVSRLKY